MAYVDKERKQIISEALKAVKKDFASKGVQIKYSLAVRNHSTIVLNIRECSIDLAKNWTENVNSQSKMRGEPIMEEVPTNIQVNQYYLERAFDGQALELMEALNKALHVQHWDDSDSMTDYFNCAYYVNINIGTWDKKFINRAA